MQPAKPLVPSVSAISASFLLPQQGVFITILPCSTSVSFGKGDTLGKKLLIDNEKIMYLLCI